MLEFNLQQLVHASQRMCAACVRSELLLLARTLEQGFMIVAEGDVHGWHLQASALAGKEEVKS